MSVGRESIRRAANAGAGKTVKKPVVSTKEAEKPETISAVSYTHLTLPTICSV